MAMGVYEPDVAQFIFQHLKAGQVFYDIGANAGYFTLIGARKAGLSGKVIAFDPVPINVETIKKQIKLNNLEAICHVEPLAISSRRGSANLTIPDKNANAHLADIDAPHIEGTRQSTITVDCVTLDHYIQKNPVPSLIKVDIEGAEVEALHGAKELLSSSNAPEWLFGRLM